MDVFPVTSSNLSAEHLARYVAQHYSLAESVTCRILKSGINDTYLITAPSGNFVFRVYSYEWRTIIEIEEELRLLAHLSDRGVSVSRGLPDSKGSYIHELQAPEGIRYAVLFTFAEGEKLQIFPADVHFAAGVVMARIHEAAEGFELQRVNYGASKLLIEPLEDFSKFLAADAEEMAYMNALQAYLLNELDRADLDEIRKGAVHMDIWFDNLNISQGNKITVFDFDFCGNGWLCLDIAYYILQLNSLERDEKECSLKVNSFMEGYESITGISAEEKRLVPALGLCMYFFYLGVQSRRYDDWSNTFFNENYRKRFITQLVKRYADINKISPSI